MPPHLLLLVCGQFVIENGVLIDFFNKARRIRNKYAHGQCFQDTGDDLETFMPNITFSISKFIL